MSGTSMDGIDAVLLRISDKQCCLEATASRPYPEDLQGRLTALAKAQVDDLHSLATADREVAREFALTVKTLLDSAACESTQVVAIGSHGQTVRHRPPGPDGVPYTCQIGDPSTIAEDTGITTIADFRRPDLAAGGEGAPLAPAFHALQFGEPGVARAIVNIGGISNATILNGKSVTAGFDCGPGNTLLDAWIRQQRGQPYDAHGAWSAEHSVIEALLESLCEDGFFARTGPKSTGVEHFNMAWLQKHLTGDESPGDVQATLAELTAHAIEHSLHGSLPSLKDVYVCGGGARNTDLMRRIDRRLQKHDTRLGTTTDLGMASEWVEAAAWAWLAHARLCGIPGNAPVVTGARGPRVLGAIYAAGSE